MLVSPTSKDEHSVKLGTSPSPTTAQPQSPASFSRAFREPIQPKQTQQTTPPPPASQQHSATQEPDSKDISAPPITPDPKASAPPHTTNRTALAVCTKSNFEVTCLAGVVYEGAGVKNQHTTVIATSANLSVFGATASVGATHGSPTGPFQVEATGVARLPLSLQPKLNAHVIATLPFNAANMRFTPYAGAQTADPRTLLNPEQRAPLASAVRIHVGPNLPTAYSGVQIKYPHRAPTISGNLGDTKFVFSPQDSFANVELRAAPREPTSVVFTFTTTPLEIRNPSSRDLLYKFQATIYTAQPFKNTPSIDQASTYGLKLTHTITPEGIARGIQYAVNGLSWLRNRLP